MRLVPIEKSEIKNVWGYTPSKNLEMLEEFKDSDLDCVKVVDWTQAQAASCSNSLNASIKRYRMNNIKAIVRKGEVYLIKKDKFKKD